MPEKRQKPAHLMTDDELARRVFPAPVHRHLKRAAQEAKPAPSRPKKSPPSKGKP